MPRGSSRVQAGVFVRWVGGAALAVLLWGCTTEPGSEAVDEIRAEAADPFELEVGDCFDDTAMGVNEVTEVPGLPCSTPHDNEVYALFDLPTGPFPGDDAIDAAAGQGCYDRFESAIGRPYEESELAFVSMYPTEASWNEIGDREVVCIAYHMEYSKLTGSVLGSGR